MSNKKIKLLYYSDYTQSRTGFGRAGKALLEYLYSTNRYTIINAAMMMPEGSPDLDSTPWKSVGTIPSNEAFSRIYQQDERVRVGAGYGIYKIDDIIKEERPDCILAAQDPWGLLHLIDKPYWNKIPCIIWTTLDSLPILDKAINISKKCQPGNFWVWSNFAEKAMKADGYTNVQTIHAPFTANEFHRLEKVKRLSLRNRLKIGANDFIILDTFRSQYRKSVYATLDGYRQFKKDNPGVQSKLLFHTCFSEGWNIPKLADYYKVPRNEVLTTYVCDKCFDYELKPFTGEKLNCPHCGAQGSQSTTSPRLGVSEEQLNEIYNVSDVLCHPANSGGLEISVIESLFCENPTLTTNYSYGEEFCKDGGPVIPLDFEVYRDLNQNEFIKAATSAKSIAKQLSKVYRMSDEERRKLGKIGREWAVQRYAVENAAKKIDSLISSQFFTNYDFSFTTEKPNPDAVIPEIEDDKEWLKTMYKDILLMDVADNDAGLVGWLEKIQKASQEEKVLARQSIEAYFRQTARSQVAKTEKVNFETLLNEDDKGKRILFVLPQSIGDLYLSTSLFRSIKEQYPWCSLYVATKPEYFSIFKGNPHVTKVLPYVPEMDNLFWAEGISTHNGWFEIAFLANTNVQRIQNYQHNGLTKIAYPIYYENDVP